MHPLLHSHLRRALVAGSLAAAALAGAACGDDTPAGNDSGLSGIYSVVAVNGDSSSPFLIFVQTLGEIAFRKEILSGALELGADGRYTVTITSRLSITGEPDDVVTELEAGTYSAIGKSVTFDPSAAGEANYVATVDGTALSFTRRDDFGGVFTVTVRK